MLQPAVQAHLAAILPPAALLTTPKTTKPYECDGLTLFRELPAAVALPENEAQVVDDPEDAATRRASRSSRAAPAPSLSGGAMPHPQRRRAVAREVQAASSRSIR